LYNSKNFTIESSTAHKHRTLKKIELHMAKSCF